MKQPRGAAAERKTRKVVRFTDADTHAPLNEDMSKFMDELEERLGVRPHKWQAVAIGEVLNGNDVLVKAGTGSGKSLCFQALAFAKKKPKATVLVIVPTIALMEDQVSSASCASS
jgi:ATP-dependent helicase YprA (DUF1998 family)